MIALVALPTRQALVPLVSLVALASLITGSCLSLVALIPLRPRNCGIRSGISLWPLKPLAARPQDGEADVFDDEIRRIRVVAYCDAYDVVRPEIEDPAAAHGLGAVTAAGGDFRVGGALRHGAVVDHDR